MKYLIVDASLSGTGIRDQYQGGYISPDELGLSKPLIESLEKWMSLYESEHYNGYSDNNTIIQLDEEGKRIARLILDELSDVKVKYFSDAKRKEELI